MNPMRERERYSRSQTENVSFFTLSGIIFEKDKIIVLFCFIPRLYTISMAIEIEIVKKIIWKFGKITKNEECMRGPKKANLCGQSHVVRLAIEG